MSTYAVERSLPGVAAGDLAGAQARAIDTAKEMNEEGTGIRYLRSLFLPESGRCTCLFEADSPEAVERLNRRAELPFERIVEAMDLPPQG